MRQPDHKISIKWFVALGAKPQATVRLFCFSHAGAGSASYRGWSDAAPQNLEVCTVQLPGRENRLREPPFTSLVELAGGVADNFPMGDGLPFAFFGHSLGAMVAFETIRQLRRSEKPMPVALFVSASRAPQLPWPHPDVRHLDDIALLTEVHRRYGSVPEVILQDVELRELLTPTLRADLTLIETYRHEPETPFDFPVLAFGGNADRMVERAALEKWSEQTSASFQLRMLEGEHLFLQSRRRELMQEIGETIGFTHTHLATPSFR